jgi:hypothetical protein
MELADRCVRTWQRAHAIGPTVIDSILRNCESLRYSACKGSNVSYRTQLLKSESVSGIGSTVRSPISTNVAL